MTVSGHVTCVRVAKPHTGQSGLVGQTLIVAAATTVIYIACFPNA